MVSLWPWRSDGSSPASFEKTLSTLSKKITTTQTQLDNARSTSRRMKVLWTLYLSFAYLVYAIVLFMVVGFKNLGPIEWTGMAGGPLLIFVVRTALTAFFNFRVDTLSSRLKVQQTERAKTIQRLKDATKYDSTLELLEKYGGSESNKPKQNKLADQDISAGDSGKGDGKRRANWTNMPPPPTANILRGDSQVPPSSPLSGTSQPGFHGLLGTPQHLQPPTPSITGLEVSAEFAPNAFSSGGEPLATAHYAPVSAGGTIGESHWYDRILDLLLGEDETAAKNRIVLICEQCRLVNGQAPPGTKLLSEIGSWKCMACGALNGEMDEGQRIVKELLGGKKKAETRIAASREGDHDNNDALDGDSSDLVEVGNDDGIGTTESDKSGEKRPKGTGGGGRNG